MSAEDIRRRMLGLAAEIAARPDASHAARDEMKALLAEYRALGAALPAELRQFADAPEESAGDSFDNLPV